MRSMRPIQCIDTLQASQNATISIIGIGWHVKTHLNRFDKTIDLTKFKAKPPPIFGFKMKNLRKTQESVWINKTLAKVCLDSDNDNGRVLFHDMRCETSSIKGSIAKCGTV